MTRAQVLEELREVLGDTVRPYKWSDVRLFNFLSLGQDQFCKETGFFRGAPAPLTTIPGQADYDIPLRTIEVLRVTLNGSPLNKFSGYAVEGAVGAPIAWQSDKVTGFISFYPAPDGVYNLLLHTWRKSLIPFSTSGDPEIPDDLQLAMVEYAAHLAHSDRDSEKFDPKRADDHKARFEDYVRQGKRAFRRLCAGRTTYEPNPLYVV